MGFLRCPNCKGTLEGLPPSPCGHCGKAVENRNGILWFTEDPPIAIEEGAPKYIGYERIGEHFEPGSVFYGPPKDWMKGVYGACSEKLVDLLGKGCTILDLGAGLGSASIPLALAGATVIAADISSAMLSVIIDRTKDLGLDNLVIARMNAYCLDLADGSVDAVVENAMLHLVDGPGMVLSEIHRVLKPNGVLARYDCEGLEKSPDEQAANDACNAAIKDIQDHYWALVGGMGYEPLWFGNGHEQVLGQYFTYGTAHPTDYSEEWHEKMRYQMHKLEHRAGGHMAGVDDGVHGMAWEDTLRYAKEKYGNGFMEMANFSRYRAILRVYGKRMEQPGSTLIPDTERNVF